jgi:hypothetical protein
MIGSCDSERWRSICYYEGIVKYVLHDVQIDLRSAVVKLTSEEKGVLEETKLETGRKR